MEEEKITVNLTDHDIDRIAMAIYKEFISRGMKIVMDF